MSSMWNDILRLRCIFASYVKDKSDGHFHFRECLELSLWFVCYKPRIYVRCAHVLLLILHLAGCTGKSPAQAHATLLVYKQWMGLPLQRGLEVSQLPHCVTWTRVNTLSHGYPTPHCHAHITLHSERVNITSDCGATGSARLSLTDMTIMKREASPSWHTDLLWVGVWQTATWAMRTALLHLKSCRALTQPKDFITKYRRVWYARNNNWLRSI